MPEEYVIKRELQEQFRSPRMQEAVVWVEKVMPNVYRVHGDYLPGPVGLDVIPTTANREEGTFEDAKKAADIYLADAEKWQTDPRYG